jgi:RelA/SpoT family (p)ppGpp synthetase
MLRQYELVERVKAYNPDTDEALINRAYVFSVQKHGTQKRASGDPYYSHPIEVAGILTGLRLDDETIVTGMLHDTIEDTLTTHDEIALKFSENVARLVDGVTKLSKIEAQSENERAAENLRKFLLAMSDDVRVLLVKLADRLHNMRTLHYIGDQAKRRRIARETMDIYAPLAERIGMYSFMNEMQTLAFRELEPDAYASITKRLDDFHSDGDQIARIGSGIKLLLSRAGIEADVYGREKHPYSIWRKMAERHVSFEQLSDVMAFRAIVPDDDACYRAIGVIHRRWPMVPGRFKDYISTPKRNGYRSIHTAIIHSEKMRIEVQVRSREMHEQAEYGLAAHWSYKQDGARPDNQVRWIRDLVEILDHADSPEELLEHTRMAMYQDRIFAFTPKGELIQLPKGASPVDFAYAVHTALGDQAVGAKINGRVVPLRTVIENGDQVEILKSKAQQPQTYWLGFAMTGKARAAIRRFVRHKERDEQIALGRKIYDDIVKRLPAKLARNALTQAVKRLKLGGEAELMTAIALQKIDDSAVMNALMPGSAPSEPSGKSPSQREPVSIRGLTPGVAYQLGACCYPVPGDRIVGLRRPDEAIEVHSIDCKMLANGIDSDWIDLAWGDGSEGASARLQVIVRNEPGALGTVSTIFGAHKANILNLRLDHRDTAFHTFEIDLEVKDRQHLTQIIAALRATELVVQADRL